MGEIDDDAAWLAAAQEARTNGFVGDKTSLPDRLPCPFCASPDVALYIYEDHAQCRCIDCGATGMSGCKPTAASAISAWNTRPSEGKWERAIKDACTVAGELGWVEADPKGSIARLIDWHVAIAIDPRVNGGLSLQPDNQKGTV